MTKYLVLKIDVDTHRGTRIGAKHLARVLHARTIPATWLWSLGYDTTGQAIFRIFQRGFFAKVARTSVIKTYGLRTLLNGTILPPPHIGKRNADSMKSLDIPLFEHGIHCWNHTKWQDHMYRWDDARTTQELYKAQNMFTHIFGRPAACAGTAGWQVQPQSLHAYDAVGIQYASDTRAVGNTAPNASPFLPHMGGRNFQALQIPTTLPTLDELIGRVHYPKNSLIPHYMNWIQDGFNVMTIHAELEGMAYLHWFTEFLDTCIAHKIHFITLGDIANNTKNSPRRPITLGTIDGRSGTLGV